MGVMCMMTMWMAVVMMAMVVAVSVTRGDVRCESSLPTIKQFLDFLEIRFFFLRYFTAAAAAAAHIFSSFSLTREYVCV